MTYGYFLSSQDFGSYISDRHGLFGPGQRVSAAGPHHQHLRDLATMPPGSTAATISSSAFTARRCVSQSMTIPGVVPTYSLSMGSGQPALTTRELPGIASTDLTQMPMPCWPRWAAISMATARLSTSPAAPPATFPAQPYCGISSWAITTSTAQDNWKLARRLTLTARPTWELPGVVTERTRWKWSPS